MALDRPFGDGRVQTANVAVSASTESAKIMGDLILFRAKRPLYLRHSRIDKTADSYTHVSDQRGTKTAEIHTSGAKRAETWRWRRGVRRRQGRRTNDEAGIRTVELQPDFNSKQYKPVENIKDI